MSQLLSSKNLALLKLATVQFCRGLPSPLVVRTYALEDDRILGLFFHPFRERNFPVTFLRDVRFLQLVLDDLQSKRQISYKMNLPTAFEEQLCVLVVAFVSREATKKKLGIA